MANDFSFGVPCFQLNEFLFTEGFMNDASALPQIHLAASLFDQPRAQFCPDRIECLSSGMLSITRTALEEVQMMSLTALTPAVQFT